MAALPPPCSFASNHININININAIGYLLRLNSRGLLYQDPRINYSIRSNSDQARSESVHTLSHNTTMGVFSPAFIFLSNFSCITTIPKTTLYCTLYCKQYVREIRDIFLDKG